MANPNKPRYVVSRRDGVIDIKLESHAGGTRKVLARVWSRDFGRETPFEPMFARLDETLQKALEAQTPVKGEQWP